MCTYIFVCLQYKFILQVKCKHINVQIKILNHYDI